MIYQYGTTYVSEADELSRVHKGLPSLRQPPITQVNRQIRQECLHIFYNLFHFSFELAVRSEEDTESLEILIPASEGQVSLQSLHKTIQSFAPTPKNMLQTSNLRFLSNLTITITFKEDDEDLGCLGFHMTSADETNFASLAVRGLDWNCRDAVRTAWVVAAQASSDYWDSDGCVEQTCTDKKLGYSAHYALLEGIISLLSLIAEHCPQLTRSVSLIYAGHGLFGNHLHDLAVSADATCFEYLPGVFDWDKSDDEDDTET